MPEITEDSQKRLEESVTYWNESPAVRTRLEALQRPPASVLLFLEYIPETAHSWMKDHCEDTAALTLIAQDLLTTTTFMNSRGMLHFDAHFKNILTDGQRFYFADFGLATSLAFDLSKVEVAFFNQHQNYDRCGMAVNLTHAFITTLYGKEHWSEKLAAYANGKLIHPIIDRYINIAVVMDTFYGELIKDKTTPYPREKLDQLLGAL